MEYKLYKLDKLIKETDKEIELLVTDLEQLKAELK